jgi:hypothetical protein
MKKNKNVNSLINKFKKIPGQMSFSDLIYPGHCILFTNSFADSSGSDW